MSRESFLKVYANLPVNLRDEIVLVPPEHGPISWKVANLEVSENTKLGQEILKKLEELNII